MSERVTMPALGESVTEGTVTRWLKNVGDRIEVDEPLLEVSTDKVDTEIPSPVAGTLQEILAQEDDTVPVGADLAVIGDGSAPASGGEAPTGESQPEPEQAPEAAAAPAPEAPSTEQEPQAATSEPEAQQAEQPQAAASSSSGGEGQTVTMPALGESVTEGNVTRWLKSEGDEVAVDEPLLEVSTDKVDTEIPSPVAGTLTKILVQEDDTVPVGADLAVIGGAPAAAAPAEQKAPETQAQQEPAQQAPAQQAPAQQAAPATDAPAQEAPAQEAPAQEAPAQDAAPAAPAESAPEPAGKPADAERPAAQQSPESAAPSAGASRDDAAAYVTPLVRKLASQHGVDLGSITGTGVGGRIRKQDVLDAAEAAKAPAPTPAAPAAAPSAPAASAPAAAGATPVSPKRGTREKMTRLRKVIATRMVE